MTEPPLNCTLFWYPGCRSCVTLEPFWTLLPRQNGQFLAETRPPEQPGNL